LAIAAFMLGKTVFVQHSAVHKIDEIISSSLTRYPEADRRVFLMGNTSFSQLSMRFQKSFVSAKEANKGPHMMGKEPARMSKCPNMYGGQPAVQPQNRRPKKQRPIQVEEGDEMAQQQIRQASRRKPNTDADEPSNDFTIASGAFKQYKSQQQPIPQPVKTRKSDTGPSSYRISEILGKHEPKTITLAPKPPLPEGCVFH